jgi:hypothetical protein
MIEEPYRWVEAIANRREYIETQLAAGSPIAAIGFRDGILLLTLGSTRQKIFEIYDRVAMGAIGHPGDIERYFLGSVLNGGNSDPKEGNSLAAWTNLSETTFLLPSTVADYKLRIFTPLQELPFGAADQKAPVNLQTAAQLSVRRFASAGRCCCGPSRFRTFGVSCRLLLRSPGGQSRIVTAPPRGTLSEPPAERGTSRGQQR